MIRDNAEMDSGFIQLITEAHVKTVKL